jgi:hypothetical protein
LYFTSDSSSQQEVRWHNGHISSVEGAQFDVIKKINKVALRGFLERDQGRGMEFQVRFYRQSDFSDEPLKGQLSDHELVFLLVLFNCSDEITTSISLGLFNSSSVGGALSGRFVGNLLSGGFADSEGLSWHLFSFSHANYYNELISIFI